MKTGRVLNLKHFSGVLSFIKQNRRLLILLAFFVIGFALGISALNKSSAVFEIAENNFTDFERLRAENGFLKIAFDSFLKSMLFIVAVFLLGASAVGAAAVPCIITVRGFLYGGLTAYLYSEYSLKGIAVSAIMFVPPAVVFSVALLFMSAEAICFSASLVGVILSRSSAENLSEKFRLYSVKLGLYSAAVAVSAIIDAFISVNFAQKLSL